MASASHVFAHASQNAAHRPRLSTDDVDLLLRRSRIISAINGPVEETDTQAERVLVNLVREEVVAADLAPNSVLLNVYNLREGLVLANEVLAFNVMAVGGAFHAGVEVYGSEWSYGRKGVCSDVPRAVPPHVYRCSIFMGNARQSKMEFAALVHRMCQQWRAADYNLISSNCCGFARELCEELGVGPMPSWVDRFSRLLHGGKEVGQKTLQLSRDIAHKITSTAVSSLAQITSGVAGGVEFMLPGTNKRISVNGEFVLLSDDRGRCVSEADTLERRPSAKPVYVSAGCSADGGTSGAAPKFPVGAVVEYRSRPGEDSWVQAKVLAYHARERHYDLNCKLLVPQDHIRWCQSKGRSASPTAPLQVAKLSSSVSPTPIRTAGLRPPFGAMHPTRQPSSMCQRSETMASLSARASPCYRGVSPRHQRSATPDVHPLSGCKSMMIRQSLPKVSPTRSQRALVRRAVTDSQATLDAGRPPLPYVARVTRPPATLMASPRDGLLTPLASSPREESLSPPAASSRAKPSSAIVASPWRNQPARSQFCQSSPRQIASCSSPVSARTATPLSSHLLVPPQSWRSRSQTPSGLRMDPSRVGVTSPQPAAVNLPLKYPFASQSPPSPAPALTILPVSSSFELKSPQVTQQPPGTAKLMPPTTSRPMPVPIQPQITRCSSHVAWPHCTRPMEPVVQNEVLLATNHSQALSLTKTPSLTSLQPKQNEVLFATNHSQALSLTKTPSLTSLQPKATPRQSAHPLRALAHQDMRVAVRIA